MTPSGLVTFTQRFSSLLLTAAYEHGYRSRFQDIRNTGVSEVRSASIFVSSTAFRDLASFAGRPLELGEARTEYRGGRAAGFHRIHLDVEARLRYMLLRNLALNLAYLLTVRTATLPSDEYLENRLQISLTYSFANFSITRLYRLQSTTGPPQIFRWFFATSARTPLQDFHTATNSNSDA